MANRNIYIYLNNYKYIYMTIIVYTFMQKTARTLNKSQSCVYFSVIFRHLPWPEESETASSLWHQHSSLGWKKEHRPTPGSSWQETRRGNLEICTEKSCWCYVFMIVLVRFVTSNDLWNLWTSMDFSGLLWTSIGFMFSYVFICFHRLCMAGTAHFYWIQADPDTASVNAILL